MKGYCFLKHIYFFSVSLLFTITVYSQKEEFPISKDFSSPFIKANKNTKNEHIGFTSPDTSIKIETFNGSFSVDIAKYNLSLQLVERRFNEFFSLSTKYHFERVSERQDELGYMKLIYQVQYNGIPIDVPIVMMHLKNGKPVSMWGQVIDIKDVITSPRISAKDALAIAKKHLGVTHIMANYPIHLLITQISDSKEKTFALAYRVRVDASIAKMEQVYVNAITGEIIKSVSLIADADVPATANTLYSGSQAIMTDSHNGSYRLRDNARKIETYDASVADSTAQTYLGAIYGNSKDYYNSTTTWGTAPKLDSFWVSTISQSWWYNAIVDPEPDLYIRVKDGSNQLVYDGRSSYRLNTSPPVVFNLNIYLTNPPYTIELWDYDPVGGDDFGGSYSVSTTPNWQLWSGNGNSGIYLIQNKPNPALDVHWGMEKTHDFYKNVFNRNSYDENGGVIKNYINPVTLQKLSWCASAICKGPNNARAMPPPFNTMEFGLGDGILFGPVVGLDVAAHEYTHMVINHIGNSNGSDSGLLYRGESGALNESFADIFGTSVEFYAKPSSANWTIGEDVGLVSPHFRRSISNPKDPRLLPEYRQPNTYQSTSINGFWADTSDAHDYGGVHINSGVQNYWFYLLCQGGSGTNDKGNNYTVSGIGMTKGQKIAYETLKRLGPHATYYDSYLNSLAVADLLYGNPSTEYNSVRAAWYAVGIGNTPGNYCSGRVRISTPIGTITDGSGSANYNDNSDCQWLIAPPGADSIKISFTSLQTENNFDTIFIYNGPDTTFPYRWWTGNWSILPTYTSSVGAILIRFKSDNTITGPGWSLNYITYGRNPTCTGRTILSNPSATFVDGSGTGNYANNQLCSWLIAPPCATNINLNFTQFNTEEGYDGIIVYDGNNTSAPILGSFSGTSIPPNITSSGGQMLVVFVSDYSVNFQGFTATYSSNSTGSGNCTGNRSVPSTTVLNTFDYGNISDGSGNSNYCNNRDCRWLIQPPQASSVTLRFSAFDVEESSPDGNTTYDAVEIYDGATIASPLLGRFTGDSLPPAITSSSGSVLVRFYTDNSVAKQGWSAYYTSTSPSYCTPSNVLTVASGSFSDGSGASFPYANNTDCSWLIQPPNAGSLKLTFTEFNTEANYDGIIVYNGSSTSDSILAILTGDTIPPEINATGGSILVRFLSDESVREPGWTANYFQTSNLYRFTGTGNWNADSNWSFRKIPPGLLKAGDRIIIDPQSNGECILNTEQYFSPGAILNIVSGKKLRIPGKIDIYDSTACLPAINTASVTSITTSGAISGGVINSQGCLDILSKGVVWSTSPNPTISLSTKTVDGAGAATFSSSLTSLSPFTNYYVRAYAINPFGTVYGNQQIFTTPASQLPSVVIGSQVWTSQNLNVLTYKNGDTIPQVTNPTEWASLTTGAWCWYNNDSVSYSKYGRLYNWYAINDPRGLAPAGWHVPTGTEWETLSTYLGGPYQAGNAMKLSSDWDNYGGSNSSGFRALPSGYRSFNGSFTGILYRTGFWTSTEISALIASHYYLIRDTNSPLNNSNEFKAYGYSIRCVRD